MNSSHRKNLLLSTALFAFAYCASLSAESFDPAPIIDDLQLRAADKPMSEHPGWAPKKVVAFMMPAHQSLIEEYKSALSKAAGDVELVFPGKGSKTLTPEGLQGVDGIISFCSPKLLKAASSSLRWVHNYTVGMDRCQGLSEEQLDSIVFTNNKRLSGPAIAEHSIAMLLSLARGLPAYHDSQSRGRWEPRGGSNVSFGELKGKTLLVVGLGGIGTEIAKRAHGLGMRVIATRNSSRTGPDYVEYVGLGDELMTLAAKADVVANALPLTEKTTGIFDKAFFSAIKPGAIFISVGRGKSTITADLVAALESGHLYGAALDVTDPEPLPAGHPLWSMKNVIITPHTSASGEDTKRRSFIIAAENLRRYVAGEPMLNVVDLRRGY